MKGLKKMKKTQTSEIKKYLLSHKKGLTSMEAFEIFGATRLSAIIYQLRYKHGMNIVTEDKKVKTRYGTPTIVSVYKVA